MHKIEALLCEATGTSRVNVYSAQWILLCLHLAVEVHTSNSSVISQSVRKLPERTKYCHTLIRTALDMYCDISSATMCSIRLFLHRLLDVYTKNFV